MFSNGSSIKEEVNKGKAGLLSLGYYPDKNWLFEFYSDYSKRDDNIDWYTLQAFLGYKSKNLWAGIQYAYQIRENSETENYDLRVGSMFAGISIAENLNLFSRIDRMFDANPDGDKIPFIPFDTTSKSILFIAGVEWMPIKEISFIPNIEFVTYDKNDAGIIPQNTLIARISFYWKYN
jgi:hypothetical protein